jgi:hypothetical protein
VVGEGKGVGDLVLYIREGGWRLVLYINSGPHILIEIRAITDAEVLRILFV